MSNTIPFPEVEFTLPMGGTFKFSPAHFIGAWALAEIPSIPEKDADPAQTKLAAERVAAVVAEVIPALADKSPSIRAGVGFEINKWFESLGKASGQ